jgi:serine/threonine protein phosphatase PrpC
VEDIVVLGSDGLRGSVAGDQIQAVVLELTPQKAAKGLVEMAITMRERTISL